MVSALCLCCCVRRGMEEGDFNDKNEEVEVEEGQTERSVTQDIDDESVTKIRELDTEIIGVMKEVDVNVHF